MMIASSGGAGIIHVHVEDRPDKRSANRLRSTLTPSQLQVLRLRAKGMTNDEVATALGVSAQTVKNHQSEVHNRLGVTDLVSAMNVLGWVNVR